MRVTVIIPTFNRAELVTLAVDSVLRQDYSDFEVIVVDDGSTDGTAERLQQYGNRIRYIRQSNAGVNAARNHGLRLARGDGVALLDNDDEWLPFKLGLQVRVLNRFPDAAFVFSDFVIRKGPDRTLPRGLSTWHRFRQDWTDVLPARHRYSAPATDNAPSPISDFDVYTGDIYHASLWEPYVLPSTALIRRARIDADIVLDENDSTCGDWEFFARLSHRHSAVYMDLETAVNRSHEDAVRLTRLPQTIQVRRRIAMIDRLWAADSEFRSRFGAELDRVRADLLIRLASLQALEGDIRDARRSLDRYRDLGAGRPTLEQSVLAALIRLPGSGLLLRAIRGARRLWRAT